MEPQDLRDTLGRQVWAIQVILDILETGEILELQDQRGRQDQELQALQATLDQRAKVVLATQGILDRQVKAVLDLQAKWVILDLQDRRDQALQVLQVILDRRVKALQATLVLQATAVLTELPDIQDTPVQRD
jgi:hypothetical protein